MVGPGSQKNKVSTAATALMQSLLSSCMQGCHVIPTLADYLCTVMLSKHQIHICFAIKFTTTASFRPCRPTKPAARLAAALARSTETKRVSQSTTLLQGSRTSDVFSIFTVCQMAFSHLLPLFRILRFCSFYAA